MNLPDRADQLGLNLEPFQRAYLEATGRSGATEMLLAKKAGKRFVDQLFQRWEEQK